LERDVTSDARRSRTGSWRLGGRWLDRAAVAVVIVLAGCNAEKHYELLSFFFDGVPEPGSAAGAPGTPLGQPGPGGRARRLATVSAHSAYAERRCENCHGDTGGFGLVVSGFSQLGADVCRSCHTEVLTEYPRTHGPVAAQECLWCHRAHESPYPRLLAQPSPDLCLGCHGFELRSLPQPPEHEDLGRNCLDCHHGHGGQQRYFLRSLAAKPAGTGETESEIEPKQGRENDLE
jgi:predicted CXXCH cytochrome family protein